MKIMSVAGAAAMLTTSACSGSAADRSQSESETSGVHSTNRVGIGTEPKTHQASGSWGEQSDDVFRANVRRELVEGCMAEAGE